ncbi:hypothetical protein CYL18_09325 [Pradoshia eiseniae]|uniref:DUF418 domain-containing protein n=1 Tax=Pradoshia eiseniae TaxID=2064768 RepID=A0A2S7N0G8_9BACI|nr:DUF418 domain-containing protein [Pradoshia eiseniae]PQD95475.1 hypothetical protein CYL18_09325 [Pradoshia eiseniae]
MRSIAESNRLTVVDLLRGIAILGILLVNMIDFHSPFLYMQADYWDGADFYTYAFVDIFAQGNFYPMFAFLFGFGAVLLMKRTIEKGMSFPLLFSRRMAFLLLVGVFHAFVIWHGDILITYAICGWFILLVYKFSGKALLILSVLLYTIPYGLLGFLSILLSVLDPAAAQVKTDWNSAAESIRVYGNGSISDIFAFRFEEWMAVNGSMNFILLFLTIFPCMLAGMAFAKLGWLSDAAGNRKKLQIMFWFSFILGLGLKIYPYFEGFNMGSLIMQDSFGGPILALAYITGITLLYDLFSLFHKLTEPFVPLGRMSMTNYLTQSIFWTLIFYSYGLGFYGQIGMLTGTILAIFFIALQAVFSAYWLKSFRMGPVEYVWRLATYGRKQPLRIADNEKRRSQKWREL